MLVDGALVGIVSLACRYIFLHPARRARARTEGMGSGCSSARTSRVTPSDGGSARPSHWVQLKKEQSLKGFGLCVVNPESNASTWAALERFLEVDDPRNLGYGRDVKQSVGKYVRLRLVRAWRIQNPALWARYAAGKDKIRADIRSIAKSNKAYSRRAPGLPLRLHERAAALPGPQLDSEVRETMLMHGTKPQVLLDILANGPNERYSGGNSLFGHGCYFGEDADKVDQYITVDPAFARLRGSEGILHARLYGTARQQKHPGNVYYILICRVALGHYARTLEKAPLSKSLEDGNPVFARGDNPRELSEVPGVRPPVHYHALIGEKGPGHARHREVIIFHGEFFYPEYLLAIQRMSPKGVALG